ncbi:MAG TPA: DUF2911 domain-containing protein [Chitinophagaceae bacterium]|nr:DUF2911 domain-containing protein [Chitinophagaceae bacterium]
MSKIFFTLLLAASCFISSAQSRFPLLDKSAMDMSYYPVNYPILRIQDKASEALVARLVYSRPLRNGRNVFGELLEYNKLWRLGANEATEIEFYKDVMVNNKVVPKGRYTLYAIPLEDKWTIIVNRETDIWGAFKYDSGKDVVRVEVPVQKQTEPLEAFTMFFEKAANGFSMVAAWDTSLIALPMTVYEKPVKKPVKKK